MVKLLVLCKVCVKMYGALKKNIIELKFRGLRSCKTIVTLTVQSYDQVLKLL